MLTEVCLYLKNWFDWSLPKYYGKFNIENGQLLFKGQPIDVKENQYYRIINSVFNDGVHKRGSETLEDEVFTGAVWLMAVPKDLLAIVDEISAWQAKYGAVNSVNMSPFSSESFGGYSYTKASGGGSANSGSVPTWQSIFKDRLWRYKKI